VALYPYGRGAADTYDWSMASLLPSMLSQLQQAGWDPSSQPLIGIPRRPLRPGPLPDRGRGRGADGRLLRRWRLVGGLLRLRR